MAKWKPGQSGNPDGKKLTAALRRVLNEVETDEHGTPQRDENGNEIKKFYRVAKALADKAAGGDTTAIEMCFNRLDGKVPNVNVEIPVKPLEEYTRDELLRIIAGVQDDRGAEGDSSLSRAKPAGSA